MRGGPRQGAGRKKGALTKRTQEVTAAALADGVTPLDYLLGVLRNTNKDEKDRFAAAVAAAPYVHPRLAAVDAKVDMDATVEVSTIELVAPHIEDDDYAAH